MKTKFLLAVALTALAAPAWADEPLPCGGEGPGATPCPPTPSPPPPIPLDVFYSGEFNYQPVSGFGYGGISNSLDNAQYAATPYYFLYGPDTTTFGFGWAANGFSAGNATSGVSFGSIAPSLGEAAVAASAQTTGVTTHAGLGLTYRVSITAADMAQADGIAGALALMNGEGANASGLWNTAVSGVATAQVNAQTGVGLGRDALRAFQKRCSTWSPAPDATGCGAGSYALPIVYIRGDQFEGGSALDFYGTIFLGTSSAAWYGEAGMASGSIDPAIKFAKALQGFDFTAAQGGTAINLAFVPEPASWALMIGGFGAIGAAARRRSRRTATA